MTSINPSTPVTATPDEPEVTTRTGYEWIPGMFGPPPGIPRETKEKLDAMTDKLYVRTVYKMSLEEQCSLFVSEFERRRSFYNWPLGLKLKAERVAKEGYYYTDMADRVRCPFCGTQYAACDWEYTGMPAFPHCDTSKGVIRDVTELNIRIIEEPQYVEKSQTYEYNDQSSADADFQSWT